MRFCTILMAICTSMLVHAQSRLDSQIGKVDPQRWAKKVSDRSSRLESKMVRKSQQTLDKLRKQERKMYQKMLHTKDSLQAKAALSNLDEQYAVFIKKLSDTTAAVLGTNTREYFPYVDTLQSAMGYLSKNGAGGAIPSTLGQLCSLNNRFQQTADIRSFIRERKQMLQDRLESMGLLKDLRKFNKEAYYYAARVKEWKAVISDPKKLEKKAIQFLAKTKLFQDFMRKNSILATLFRLPEDPADPTSMASLAGLQTRAQVNNLIQQQIAAGGPNALAQVQQNLQQAQSQLNSLKARITQSGGSSSDDEMPDFKPNTQKTKGFFNRLEYGTNVQTIRARSYFPVTSDLGLSLGYKLNDKSVIGIGGSYKLGWGTGWRNIRLSQEGVSLRSFLDYKVKKALWVSGGYEMNHLSRFSSINQLRSLDSWQQSGLMGLTKSFPVKTKFFKSTKIQLLWDFLSYQQIPRTQPVIFRLGYNF